MQRVLADAMAAGAAGFATSFAIPHRGVDGKPVPSRFADLAEFEAMLDVMHEAPRRRRHRSGCAVHAPGHVRVQPRAGVPFTWGALLTSPTGMHQKTLEGNREGWARGAEVWPRSRRGR